IELLQRVPLIKCMFSHARPPWTWDLQWLDVAQVRSEAMEAHPGISALKLGYIPVAQCLLGSGNPFFVRFDSDDPAIVQILHDVFKNNYVLIPESFVMVSPTLSAFFADAVVI